VVVLDLNGSEAVCYRTTGQVARALRVSVSTLKRWLEEFPALAEFRTNASGWRLFNAVEVESLRAHQRQRKRQGKIFKPSTLRPVDE
jgi:hypothetical protein